MATVLVAVIANAQISPTVIQQAFDLVQANKQALNLSDYDAKNAIVASTYKNKFAGTTMVYLQQTFKGVPIYNQLLSLAFKDNKLVSKSGAFISNLQNSASNKSPIATTTANEAVMAAISDRKLTQKDPVIAIVTASDGNKVTFNNAGISNENITATLMWFVSETGKQNIQLGWQVYIIQNNSADYWLVNIDAVNKSTISVHNLTVYCNYDAPKNSDALKQHIHNNDCATKANTNNQINANNSPTVVNNATYRVVPYPAESPSHTGGAPVVVTNPWLLSGAVNNATTLKWHSIGATDYNLTRGNNVWAQEDVNGNNGTSAAQVISTNATDPLSFDFVPDFTQSPILSWPCHNVEDRKSTRLNSSHVSQSRMPSSA